MTSQPIRHPIRILGIDPGLRRTGWGVIEIDGNRLAFVGCGSVEPPDSLSLANRLLAIHGALAAVLGEFQPAEAAVEQTFVNKDGVATLKLGQARGVAICAAASLGASVHEYAPRAIKMAVTGYGAAAKPQVAQMVRTLLRLDTALAADAADALAAALCHSQTRRLGALGSIDQHDRAQAARTGAR